MEKFLVEGAKDSNVIGVKYLTDLVLALKRPRKVILMVKAGHPVDYNIEQLVPLLE